MRCDTMLATLTSIDLDAISEPEQNLLYTGLAASEAVSAPGEGATSPQLADLQRQVP